MSNSRKGSHGLYDPHPHRTHTAVRTQHGFESGSQEGFIETNPIEYARTEEGRNSLIEDIKRIVRERSTNAPAILSERIDEKEMEVRLFLRKAGCESSYEKGIIREFPDVETALAAAEQHRDQSAPELGSVEQLGISAASAVEWLRLRVALFEKKVDDKAVVNDFCLAVMAALELGQRMNVLAFAFVERDVLRGREENYNHSGRTEEEQRLIVAAVRQSMGSNPSRKERGAAVKHVAEALGCSTSAVYRWLKKFPK